MNDVANWLAASYLLSLLPKQPTEPVVFTSPSAFQVVDVDGPFILLLGGGMKCLCYYSYIFFAL